MDIFDLGDKQVQLILTVEELAKIQNLETELVTLQDAFNNLKLSKTIDVSLVHYSDGVYHKDSIHAYISTVKQLKQSPVYKEIREARLEMKEAFKYSIKVNKKLDAQNKVINSIPNFIKWLFRIKKVINT